MDTRHLVLLAGGIALSIAGLSLRVHSVRRSDGGASQSMHAVTATFVLYMLGMWPAVVAVAIASVAYDVHRRRALTRLAGNLPTRIIPIVAGGAVWAMLGGAVSGGVISLPTDYVPLIASAVAFALANELSFLWDARSARDLNRARWRDELDRFPSNLGTTILEALVGAGVAALCLDNPSATLIVVPLAASMYLALDRSNRIQEVTDRALDTFAAIVDERDRYTFEHSDRVCEHALDIGRRLGLTERQLEGLYWTSRLHDLGKVAVDNAILNKPGRLSEDEFEIMRRHAEVSARILSSFSFDSYDAEVVRCHHERYDGRGYLGRSPEDVPLESFIIAVADAFDAMTSDRPYRAALPEQVALEEIALGIGTQFHPDPARALLSAYDFDLEARLSDLMELREAQARGERAALDLGDDIRDVA